MMGNRQPTTTTASVQADRLKQTLTADLKAKDHHGLGADKQNVINLAKIITDVSGLFAAKQNAICQHASQEDDDKKSVALSIDEADIKRTVSCNIVESSAAIDMMDYDMPESSNTSKLTSAADVGLSNEQRDAPYADGHQRSATTLVAEDHVKRKPALSWIKKLGSSRRTDLATKSIDRKAATMVDPMVSSFYSYSLELNSTDYSSKYCSSKDKLTVAGIVQDMRQYSEEDSQIVLLPDEEFWSETANSSCDIHRACISLSLVNVDQSAKIYENEFLNKSHTNYVIIDTHQRRMLLSLLQGDEENNCNYRTILRTCDKTIPGIIDRRYPPQPMSLEQIIGFSHPGIQIASFKQLTGKIVPTKLVSYDRQAISRSFKFGFLYQRKDQITEEEMYSNTEHSEGMQLFLDFLARRVLLADHKGFCGGLDTKYGLTGSTSYYTLFEDNEVMFHVSMLLPHSGSDIQQIERKRHIGNDIVTIIFQEPGALFCPSVISSQFLQVFICIQPVNSEQYRVGVAARSGISRFGPFIEGVGYYRRDDMFRKCLLSKLINAQIAACNSSSKIGSMLSRRRQMLFNQLYDQLTQEDDLDDKVTDRRSIDFRMYSQALDRRICQRSRSVDIQPLVETKHLSLFPNGDSTALDDHVFTPNQYSRRYNRLWTSQIPKLHSV